MDKKSLYTAKECHVLDVIRHNVAFDWEKREKRTSWSQTEYTDEVARRYAVEKVEEWSERYGGIVLKVAVTALAVGFCIGVMTIALIK